MTWYTVKKFAEAICRPYEPESDDLKGVSVSEADKPIIECLQRLKELGVPLKSEKPFDGGFGFVFQNPKDSEDLWYVSPKFFRDNYQLVGEVPCKGESTDKLNESNLMQWS